MHKAARRSTTTETNCPAAAMAKLIGLNFELGFDFSEREHWAIHREGLLVSADP